MTDRRLALAAAVRVIAGVHNRTADSGTETFVAGLTGFAELDCVVLNVADLTDCRLAIKADLSYLTGGKTDEAHAVFLGNELCCGTGGTNELAALAGVKLDVVDNGTDGDVCNGQSVAGLDIGIGAAVNGVAGVKSDRSDNVALLAGFSLKQCDISGTVGVVFDADDLGGSLVQTAEIDYTIFPPPLWRTVILPFALRPAFFFLITTRLFSGLNLVSSSKVGSVICLLEGVVGLSLIVGITLSSYFLSSYRRRRQWSSSLR